MVAALASWLDAKSNGGTWLVRIEDLDHERCITGMDEVILRQLAQCRLLSDEPVIWQSKRLHLYEQAFAKLQSQRDVYPCTCSRKDIFSRLLSSGQSHARHTTIVYPGTCKSTEQVKHEGESARACSWRFCSRKGVVHWLDRRLGTQTQEVSKEVGDFVVKRADGVWSYQLSVVVDDAQNCITHVVRGADLVDNTPRQIQLQQALGYPALTYLHTPLVCGENGEKLSKQNAATPANTEDPLLCLSKAARALGLHAQHSTLEQALHSWVSEWSDVYPG
jgi:glutamyl-Q tRNA(Asp) synthetase